MAEFVSVVSRPLSKSEQETNATYIYNYLGARGWTVNAIAAALGNFQAESTINPGRYQGDSPSGSGWGLAQWTPHSKYTNWCDERGLEWSHMDSALERILYEVENGIQFGSTSEFPMTFKEFTVSTDTPGNLAKAFVRNYERPASVLFGYPEGETQAEHEAAKAATYAKRAGYAEAWYEFLTGLPAPNDPSTDKKKRKGMSFLLLYLASRK